MVKVAEEVRKQLKEKGYRVSLVNARFVKPLDEACIEELCQTHRLIVTMEENVLNGGFGEIDVGVLVFPVELLEGHQLLGLLDEGLDDGDAGEALLGEI